MGRPLSGSLILLAALAAIGCSEKGTAPPTAPDFHTGLTLSSECDFSHLGQLANSFLQPPAQQTAKANVDAMTAAGAYSFIAKDRGFDIMALMEGAVNGGTAGDPEVGSNLMNHLLLCMYDPTDPAQAASYPVSFPDTFNVALTVTASAHGGFGHRSGTSTSPIYSRPISAPFSGVAPPKTGSPATVSTWGSVISPPSTNDPDRVVFYGRPATGTGATNQTYDWRTIPRNAAFDPHIIVGICIDPFATANNTTMLNAQSQQNVTILAFADAYFLSPGSTPGSCSQDLTLLELNSPFLFAQRMIRFGTGLFTPRPLMATVATVLSPGGLGGSNSRAGTKYGPTIVPSPQLTFVPDPPFANVQAGRPFLVQVRAMAGGVGVNGDCISLTAVNNNGTNTALIQVVQVGWPTCGGGTDPSSITTTVNNIGGIAQFCVKNPKTGTIKIVANGSIEGRPDIPPATGISKKVNVKPSVNVATCTSTP